MADWFFYVLCTLLLGLAGMAVLARNLFRSALALLGVLLGTAMLFILLSAEMVALVQIMVYIGGILTFILFAVLLTSELGGTMAKPSLLKWVGGGFVAALGTLVLMIWTQKGVTDAIPSPAGQIASVTAIGWRLLDPGPNGFLIPFELISILLLAAMIGAIAIAQPKGKPEDKA